jgi:hypothetical protein
MASKTPTIDKLAVELGITPEQMRVTLTYAVKAVPTLSHLASSLAMKALKDQEEASKAGSASSGVRTVTNKAALS